MSKNKKKVEEVVEEIKETIIHTEEEKEVIKEAEVVVKEQEVVEKKEKKSLEERLKDRKKHIKETFLACVKEHNSHSKFNTNTYLSGTGGKGLLCEALKDFNPNDRVIFQELLEELKEDKTLYHIGGPVYVLN